MLRSLLIALALFIGPSASLAQTAALTTIKVGVIPSEVCGQLFYGIDEGFFKKNGLDVQLQFFTNGAAVTAAVVGGSLDAGLSDLSSAIAAHARGIPITYVAPGLVYSDKAPTFAIAVAKTSTVRTAKDLHGAFASSGLGNIAQLATEAWIDRNGGDLKSLKFLEMPPPVVQNALTQGTIQASTLNEPWLSDAAGNGFHVILMTNGMAPAYMLSGWVTTKEWAANNPGTLAKFVASVREASQWANRNQKASAPILAKYTKISEDVIGRMRRGQFIETWTNGLVQPVIDAAVKYGRIPTAFQAADIFYPVR
jgi:NitT/TauT family transport system substrate-binding protein